VAEFQEVMRTARPAPPLRPFIESYVGYRLVGFPPGLHRGLPSRHLTFIASIGDPIDVVLQTDARQGPDRYRFVVSGLQASSALIAHNGNQEGVAVELTPLGCRALFGMPARNLWNTSLEADEVVGRPGDELWERLQFAREWPDRFAACDDVLARLVDPNATVEPGMHEAWRLLVASGGTVLVADVATHVGWGRRNLAQRFTDEFGLSPKLAARVIRFERARRMLQAPERPAIAAVAALCGYYDQPHLNRDFVELAGCPPGEWLDAEFPSVQDDDPVQPAGSVA
jgi:AraC-like DNA-binding protein